MPSRLSLRAILTNVTLPYNVWKLFFPVLSAAEPFGQSHPLLRGTSNARIPMNQQLTYLPPASLVDILKRNPGPQMSYQVGFCLWLLTFEQEIAEQINKYVVLELV